MCTYNSFYDKRNLVTIFVLNLYITLHGAWGSVVVKALRY